MKINKKSICTQLEKQKYIPVIIYLTQLKGLRSVNIGGEKNVNE